MEDTFPERRKIERPLAVAKRVLALLELRDPVQWLGQFNIVIAAGVVLAENATGEICLLYTSPSPRDA